MKPWKHLHKTIGGGRHVGNEKAIEALVAAHNGAPLEVTDDHRTQVATLAESLEAKGEKEHADELRTAIASLESPKKSKK